MVQILAGWKKITARSTMDKGVFQRGYNQSNGAATTTHKLSREQAAGEHKGGVGEDSASEHGRYGSADQSPRTDPERRLLSEEE